MTVFAVANTALINMLMASRLIYGMANQGVLPRGLGKVLPGRRSPWAAIVFTTVLALGSDHRRDAAVGAARSIAALAGTTALLLLAVFAVVNIACLVLRRDPAQEGAFRAPTIMPVLGAICVPLPARAVGPAGGGHDPVQDRRRPARARRRPLGDHVRDQQGDRSGRRASFDDVDHLAN